VTEARCHLFWAPLAIPLALLAAGVLAVAVGVDRYCHRRTR
jgi:hypothetical protein